jgi:hypothetical protein
MVLEIGELDNTSERTRLARCVGDPLYVGAVVLVLGAGKECERAELGRAHPLGAQLVDSEARTLQDVVKPRGDARVIGNCGRDAVDVIELWAARRCVLPVMRTLRDRPRSRFSHKPVPDVINTPVADEPGAALPVSPATGARRPPPFLGPASS